MKIHILSDLHNQFSPFEPPATDADVVILAGDIDGGCKGIDWATKKFSKPVIYLAGNHEYYHHDIAIETDALRQAAKNTNVHFLECDTVVIDEVRFIGTTLWTDFRLNGDAAHEIAGAKNYASQSMNDFRCIWLHDKKFTPEDSVLLFEKSVQFLRAELEKPFAGKTVVVTHHTPSPRSVHVRYKGDLLNAAFSSNVEFLMDGPSAPALWIHGHTHDSHDYTVHERTRVIANPRGYTSYHSNGQENEFFRPALVVEIEN
jgi:Icc-related predicted phosphoesterase